MTQGDGPYRPVQRRRLRIYIFPVGLVIAFGVFLAHLLLGARTVTGDFRDPVTLARAVAQGAQRNGDGTPFAESCVQLAFPNYFCTVDFYGGAIGSYNVTVAVDGSSWVAN